MKTVVPTPDVNQPSAFQNTRPSALRTLIGVFWRPKAAPQQNLSQPALAAVCDAEAVPAENPLDKIDDVRIRHMVGTQRFKQSSVAARHLINKARSLRQERVFQKGAAEHAVYQCDTELEYYGSGCDEEMRARVTGDLECRQNQLDEAKRRLARGDHDLGVVSSLLGQAGYPPFPLDPGPARFPLQPYFPSDSDEASESSCEE